LQLTLNEITLMNLNVTWTYITIYYIIYNLNFEMYLTYMILINIGTLFIPAGIARITASVSYLNQYTIYLIYTSYKYSVIIHVIITLKKHQNLIQWFDMSSISLEQTTNSWESFHSKHNMQFTKAHPIIFLISHVLNLKI